MSFFGSLESIIILFILVSVCENGIKYLMVIDVLIDKFKDLIGINII